MASGIKGYIVICSVLLFSCNSSIIPSLPEHNQIVISEGDSVYTIQILNVAESQKIKPENKSFYYYYTHGRIQNIEGGHQGKLLHGNFVLENSQHALLERGKFNYGRKTGEWKRWHDNGYLKEIVHWQNGVAQGEFFEYTPTGALAKQGSYKNGKLHGQLITIVDGQEQKTKYNRGELIMAKPPKEKKEKQDKKEKIKKEKPAKEQDEKKPKENREKDNKRSKKDKSPDQAPENKPQKKKEKKSGGASDGQGIRKK